MNQIPLRTILIESMNENSENFANFQNYLQEMVNNDYQNLVQQLLIEVKDANAPYNIIFLSLVLMDHCIQASRIPINTEVPYLQSKLPLELILQLFDVAFEYLLHPETAVRNEAVKLFSHLAVTQLFRLSELQIDFRIVGMLNDAKEYETLYATTQCIWSLMSQYNFNDQQKEIIVQNLFRILSIQDENITLLQSSIRMLGNFSYLVKQLFNDDAKFFAFVTNILDFSQHQELSEVVYQFMDDAISQNPEILPCFIDRLLLNSISDLTTPSPRNVLIALIVMWDSIFRKDPPIVNESVKALVEPLILTMQTVSFSEVLDYTEWEPYTAAFNCLQCFGYNLPDVVVPILLNYTKRASDSENSLDREGSLKCLHISFQVSPSEKIQAIIPSALQLLALRLSDAAPRVRSQAVLTLNTIIKRSNSCEFFQPFFPSLFKLTSDVEPTAKAAFKSIKLISQFNDFQNFPDFFQLLINLIPTLPPSLLQNGIECFTLTSNSQVTDETSLIAFRFLFELLGQMVTEITNNHQKGVINTSLYIFETLCITLSSVIVHCTNAISPYVQDLSKMMYVCFESFLDSNSLLVIAHISVPLPDFVQTQLPVFIPLVFRALQMHQEPTILIPAVKLVPLLIDKLDLSNFLEVLINTMFETLQKGETVSSKVETLKSFYQILCDHPLLLSPFIDKLHSSLLFIILNLNVAFQNYFEVTERIVKIVSKIQLQLLRILSNQDKKHIFKACVMLIVAVEKIPPLIKYCCNDLLELIRCLYLMMPREMNVAVVKVPSIMQIIRIGLKQIEKTDSEIDEWLSILSNSNES